MEIGTAASPTRAAAATRQRTPRVMPNNRKSKYKLAKRRGFFLCSRKPAGLLPRACSALDPRAELGPTLIAQTASARRPEDQVHEQQRPHWLALARRNGAAEA